MKYFQKYGRQGNSITHCSNNATLYVTRIQYILPFPKKGDLGIAETNHGITLSFIVAKIYNALLLNHIEPEIEKILRKFLKKPIHNIPDSNNLLNLRSLCTNP